MLIKGQADIEVAISDGGYIILKQRDHVDGDQMVCFAPAYAPKVAEAIASLKDFAQKKFEKLSPSDD